MRKVLVYLSAALIGTGIGAWSALDMAGLIAGDRRTGAGIDIGGWVGDLSVGSADADPYLRARIARHGLLALAKSEAIYFTRDRDDAGTPFSEQCRYRLSGEGQPALWWSITLYDDRSFLPDNTDGALSFDASRADGKPWSVTISPARPADGSPWISSRNAGRFDLTMRIYVPDAGVLERPAEMIHPPKVEKLDCAGGAG